MIRAVLLRDQRKEEYTIGRLRIDDPDSPFSVFTLEDTVRAPGVKIPGKTAIPAGIYTVVLDFSPRFGKNLPHILDVPGFDGVRIHPGNTDADTEGCILVGLDWKGGDFIGRSREAFEALCDRLTFPFELEIRNA